MSGSGSNADMKNSLQPMESIIMDAALFEKLYLSPQTAVKGDLRKTFGNPTPLALAGFVVALSPISIQLMGWRGASGLSANVGALLWVGGFLLIVAGILEFFLGNTFPSVVFFGYGAHFFVFGTTFQPFYGAVSAYTTDGSQTQTAGFANSFGFYSAYMAVLSLVYLICSLRTNLVFVGIFFTATTGFAMAASSFWQTSQGRTTLGANLLVGTGACFFVASVLGWYLLCVIMFAELDLPWGLSKLPVVDLSTMIKGASQKKQRVE